MATALDKLIGGLPSNQYSPTPSRTPTPVPSKPFRFDGDLLITGSNRQQLSAMLSASGYEGPMRLDELTVCAPDDSDLRMGQSDVSATKGFLLESTGCKTERSCDQLKPIDAAQIYLFTGANGKIKIRLRSE